MFAQLCSNSSILVNVRRECWEEVSVKKETSKSLNFIEFWTPPPSHTNLISFVDSGLPQK